MNLKRLYAHYNRRWFEGKLPRRCAVRWAGLSRAKKDAECVYGAGFDPYILINACYRHSHWIPKMLLLHEMVHLNLRRKIAVGHGPRFQREMLRLAKLGVFKDIW